MIRYLFFDLDGTLTDSSEGIYNCIEYALNRYGVTVADRSTLRKYIGPPLTTTFSDYFTGERIQDAVLAYRERYSKTGWKENRVYDGVLETLKKLKGAGYILVMATSKPEEFAKNIAEYFHFADCFDYICGATFDGTRSGKAEVFRYAMDVSGAKPDEIYMVGDRYYDVKGAMEFGVATLGVTYGFGTEQELKEAGASAIAETPAEVASYLLSMKEEA